MAGTVGKFRVRRDIFAAPDLVLFFFRTVAVVPS
jgi:hypothetical protein